MNTVLNTFMIYYILSQNGATHSGQHTSKLIVTKLVNNHRSIASGYIMWGGVLKH